MQLIHFPNMQSTYMRTACFEQWQINFSTIQHLGLIFYKFSIFDQITGSQYDYPDVYSTETKAYLSAYFVCLRASLDRDPRSALLVELETGHILSINLPAYELLKIDAVGAKVFDFIVSPESCQPIDQQIQQIETPHQITSLCDADGLLMECEIKVELAPYYSRWAIFYLKANQSQPCFAQLSH